MTNLPSIHDTPCPQMETDEMIKAGIDPYEFVHHPPHYQQHPSGVECITIIQHFSYNVGAAVKYLWRVGLKPNADSIEDLRKGVQYIEFEIKRLEDNGL